MLLRSLLRQSLKLVEGQPLTKELKLLLQRDRETIHMDKKQ